MSVYAAYAFDEGSGSTIIDHSGNSRDMTIVGTNSWVAGHGSYANAFQSGASGSDGAAWDAGSAIAALSGDVTVQLWYKYTGTAPPGTTKTHAGGLYSAPGTGRLVLWPYRNLGAVAASPEFTIRDSAGSLISAGNNGSVADNSWHNAACVYHSSGLIEVYLDGTQVYSASPTANPIGSVVRYLGIGSAYSSSVDAQAVIQDMRVFNAALSGSEITTWMNTPVHPATITGTAAVTLRKMIASGSGDLRITGTAAVSLKKMVVSGSGGQHVLGSIAVTFRKMAVSGYGLVSATVRQRFQVLLESLDPGVHVYFQPPPNVQMIYPAIVYNRDYLAAEYADNFPYMKKFRWQITLIDPDPDSPLHEKFTQMPLMRYVRHYTSEQLNHDIYDVYF